MSLEKLQAKLKDWEDRFFVKYSRNASLEDIEKNPKVDRVYQEIKKLKKQQKEIITPSPFKQSNKGLFKSLSLSNVIATRPKPFLKRLSESQESPRKRSAAPRIDSDLKIQEDFKADFSKLNRPRIEKVVVKPELPIQDDKKEQSKENNLEFELKKQHVTISENSLLDKGPIGGFTKVFKSEEIPIMIEQDDNSDKLESTVIRRMVGESGQRRSLPIARKWSTLSPKLEPSRLTLKNCSPLIKSKTEIYIPPPSEFINSSRLKRQNSFIVGDLPKNYADFLTPDEIKQFSEIISEVDNGVPKSNIPIVNMEHGENIDVPVENLENDSMDSNSEKNEKESDVSIKKDASPKKKATKKKSVATKNNRQSTKSNENYRAFKLKPKPGGTKKIGSKFQNARKLASYNYAPSTKQHLIAGYEEQMDVLETIDTVTGFEDNKHIDTSFIQQEQTVESIPVSICYTCKESSVNLESALKSLTGFTSFRTGQAEVVKRILSQKSTLFILPTGGGKSLCYQLPAFIIRHLPKEKHSMALIITPTISLMYDQMRCVFPGIRAGCLSSVETAAQTKSTINKIQKGMLDILFISPEKLQSDSFKDLCRSDDFPAISFACIDEAHCISEWSHNFRTAYLHLRASLVEMQKIKCILALTGTCTVATRGSICKMLDIDPEEGVISCGVLRNNLVLSISHVNYEDNRENTLLDLLKTNLYQEFQSIIIYVMFQFQADKLAQFLRIRQIDADAYHSGRAQSDRTLIQARFMRNDLRVIIATVAFGMGINKRDVDSVIHYCMPKSIESYIQEIGRAGRDGRMAYCHTFLSKEDYIKHRSLVFSEHANQTDVLKFLNYIFLEQPDGYTFVGLDIVKSERQFDMKQSVLKTILSCLQLKHPELIELYPENQGLYTLYTRSGTTLEGLKDDVECFVMIDAVSTKIRGGIEFDIIKASNEAKIEPRKMVQILWDLQMKNRIKFKTDKKMFMFKILNLELSREQIQELASDLFQQLEQLERVRVLKLDETYEMLNESSTESLSESLNQLEVEKKESQCKLDTKIENYFQRTLEYEQKQCYSNSSGFRDPKLKENQKKGDFELQLSIKQFIRNYPEVDSGIAIARIFHGIQSPKFSAFEWSTNEYWGKFTTTNFTDIFRKASKALLGKKD